jgi:hypothetical protein
MAAIVAPGTVVVNPRSNARSELHQLFDEVRERIRVKHYSLQTKDTHVHWITRFVLPDVSTTIVYTHLAQ